MKEHPLAAGQVAGPNIGAPGATPGGIFPASVVALNGMDNAQITALAIWYGIDGTIIPPAAYAALETQRDALKMWIGVL